MRIGLLLTSIGSFGQQGFYNSQEIGLAKGLDILVDEVRVYKLVSIDMENRIEKIVGCRNSTIQYIPAKSIGINGMPNMRMVDSSLDAIIYFSDTQLALSFVYRWAKKNKVCFLPYIGVLESHSINIIRKIVMDFLGRRNQKVYRRCRCLVKTPAISLKLGQLGVKQVTVAPVGLDISLLHDKYEIYNPIELKRKYGYLPEDKVLLFIGRLTKEKQPMKMIQIYADIAQSNSEYKLLMIGTGELKDTVIHFIREKGISENVQLIERIPNCDIWEVYRFADAFVNLNRQEIFGMAILEAMYYGCKVVAWKASGPDFIIENGVSGFLVDSDEAAIQMIINGKIDKGAAHKRIMNFFIWDTTANEIIRQINEMKQIA